MKLGQAYLMGQIGWFIGGELKSDEYHWNRNFTCVACGEKIGKEKPKIVSNESYCPKYHLKCYVDILDEVIGQLHDKSKRLKVEVNAYE